MRRKPTLIMTRRAPTEPKVALACVILESSFARSRASIAPFNEERAPSGPFGCRDFAAMVETQGSRKKMIQHTDCKDEPEP